MKSSKRILEFAKILLMLESGITMMSKKVGPIINQNPCFQMNISEKE